MSSWTKAIRVLAILRRIQYGKSLRNAYNTLQMSNELQDAEDHLACLLQARCFRSLSKEKVEVEGIPLTNICRSSIHLWTLMGLYVLVVAYIVPTYHTL